MKRKTKHIIVLSIIAAVIIGLLYCGFVAFNGSIIARAVTTLRVKNYVSSKYENEPYEVGFARYDFKCNMYFCIVQSSESEDTRFSVWNSKDGIRDDFESSVGGRENTYLRLQQSIDDYAEKIVKKAFKHKTSLVLCDRSETTDEKNDIKNLTLDMPFSVKDFPFDCTLTVWVETAGKEPTWEELAERFKELDNAVGDKLPSVKYYSLSIQDKYTENDGTEPKNRTNEVCAFNVPKDVIVNGDLTQYLKNEKAKQDAENEQIANGETVK